MARMSTWVAAVRVKLQSEHPNFELLQTYTVFSVTRRPATGSVGVREEIARKELDRSSIKKRIGRLADFYGFDAKQLQKSYFQLQHLPAHLTLQAAASSPLGQVHRFG